MVVDIEAYHHDTDSSTYCAWRTELYVTQNMILEQLSRTRDPDTRYFIQKIHDIFGYVGKNI